MLFLVPIVSISSHINELDAKSFQKAVLDSRNPYVVFFYDSDMIKDEEGQGALRDMEAFAEFGVSVWHWVCYF